MVAGVAELTLVIQERYRHRVPAAVVLSNLAVERAPAEEKELRAGVESIATRSASHVGVIGRVGDGEVEPSPGYKPATAIGVALVTARRRRGR